MDALRALDRGKDGQEYNATSINAGFLALSLFFSLSPHSFSVHPTTLKQGLVIECSYCHCILSVETRPMLSTQPLCDYRPLISPVPNIFTFCYTGFRAGTGGRCEAVVSVPVLLGKYPFPFIVNAVFLKLADLFCSR